jgi:small-conductance mechanosensitive channel
MMSAFEAWAADYLWRLPWAALVLGAGIAAAYLLRQIVFRWVTRTRSDLSLTASARRASILPWLTFCTALLVTLLVVLSVVGVPFTFIGTFVTVGIALGFVTDIYSGVRIFTSQIFHVGDVLEIQGDGIIGTVSRITLSTTVLTTKDRVDIIIPNRKLTERTLLNHSISGGKSLAFRMELKSSLEIEEVEFEIKRIPEAFTENIIGEVKCGLVKIDDAALTFAVSFRVRYMDADRLESAFLKAAVHGLKAKEIDVRVLTVENSSTN